MTRYKYARLTLFSIFALVGCHTQLGISGQEREDYLKSIKTYGEHWIKQGATLQQRREDSWACGAARTIHGADYVVFTVEQEKAEKHAEENDEFAARTRLSRAWVNCMKGKGYRYMP
jgi:hypothetical protein